MAAQSFTQADGVALRDQVQALTTQLATMMAQNDSISGEFDTFRTQATAEIVALKKEVAEAKGAATASLTRSSAAEGIVKLADLKDYKPDKFSGKRDSEYKAWRKRFLIYVNMQCPGFRAALQWVEKRDTPIDAQAIATLAWEK